MKVPSLIAILGLSCATAKMVEVPMETREISPGVNMPVSVLLLFHIHEKRQFI